MRKVMKLISEYKTTQSKLDELFDKISEIMKLEVYYNGVKCHPINFDIDDEAVTLAPLDGESTLSPNGKYIKISFNDFEALLYSKPLKHNC